jgi:hypothetical protein
MTFEEAKVYVAEWLSLKVRTGRCSQLLIAQIAVHTISRTADMHSICDQIGHLENPSGAAFGTKPAQQFKNLPLKGLWHQHWFEARFMARNLMNDAHSEAARRIFQDMADAPNRGDNPVRYVHELVIGGYERRFGNDKMTGEWIVYAKVDDVNYYLTLGTHAEGDGNVFERVKLCSGDFPGVDLLAGRQG